MLAGLHALWMMHSVLTLFKCQRGASRPTAVKQVTCTDQDTAEVGEEPLVTLKEFRSSAALGWQMSKSSVFFGWNLVPIIEGKIQVSDNIEVTHRRTTIVAMPSKADKVLAQRTTAKPQEKADILKGAGVAALQGIAAAVCVASILISFMYVLIQSTNSQEPHLKPT